MLQEPEICFYDLPEPKVQYTETDTKKLHEYADRLSSIVWVVSATAEWFWFNKAWYDYTGLTESDASHWAWQDSFLHEDIRRVTGTFYESLSEHKPWEEVFMLRDKHGDYHWFLSRGTPSYNTVGEICNWVIIMTDVNECMASVDWKRLLKKGGN